MAESIDQTQDAGFIIAGNITTPDNPGHGNVVLLKIDRDGLEQWQRIFIGEREDRAVSVQETIDQGFIIGGNTTSFGHGYWDMLLIKTDPHGNGNFDESLR